MNLQPVDHRFRFRTADALRAEADRLGLSLPFRQDVGVLLKPTHVGSAAVPNSLAAQPMEGCDAAPDGTPSELTERRYRRIAEGGSGLIWVEATAVVANGRANPHQLHLSTETAASFSALADLIRDAARQRFGPRHTPYLVLQLTHSGRFSRGAAAGTRRVACANPHLGEPALPVWTDDELEHIRDAFVEAAHLANDSGFDAVDIKACHGYLFHELLGARGRTSSHYGGPRLYDRARLLIETISAIHSNVPGLTIASRTSVTGGTPFPFAFGLAADGSGRTDLTEPLQVIRWMTDTGCRLLNVSAGVPTYDPHVGRPFDRPVVGTPAPPEHPLVGVVRLLDLARDVQRAVPTVPVVATGLSWLRQFWPHTAAAIVADGAAAFAGLGRSVFAYPDAPADLMKAGTLSPTKCCIACSRCTELMRFGAAAGCAVRDRPLYVDLHRETMARAGVRP
jgi:2,4-dienoyl-CoA reductase (NADPH2)